MRHQVFIEPSSLAETPMHLACGTCEGYLGNSFHSAWCLPHPEDVVLRYERDFDRDVGTVV